MRNRTSLVVSSVAVMALALGSTEVARAQDGCPAAWVPGIGTAGTNGIVAALAVQPGGDVILGGSFSSAGGVPASNIARYNSTTGAWSALANGTSNAVTAFAALPSGEVIVGGQFVTAGGFAISRLARVDPTTGVWSPVGPYPIFGTGVSALAVLPGGDVIAGGAFGVGGLPGTLNIARFNLTTGVPSALGSGINNPVFALAVLPGGDVIAGGQFTTAGGVPASSIARYNPGTNIWSALGSGTNGEVRALAVLPGGDVIVAGGFSAAGGVASSNIARYNPNTGLWSALGSGTNFPVLALAVRPDGNVFVGGGFNTAGGVSASGVAQYNPSTGEWSGLGSGVDNNVWAMAALPGGDVVAGGFFTTAGARPANFIARYNPGASVPGIFSQPQPAVTAASSSAVFYCGAIGGLGSPGNPTYQWRKGGVAMSTIANPSAATAGLTLTNVQAADIGSYDCLVTNSCGGSGTVSNAATLTLVAPPISPACSLADIAGSLNGGVPVPDGIVDGNDFIEFINAFAAGC